LPDDQDVARAATETQTTRAARDVHLDQVAREASTAQAKAELRALRAESDARSARRELATLRREITTGRLPPSVTEATPPSPRPQRVYYDATLIIGFGLASPVGLTRADQYLAEFLSRDPSLEVVFLMFDAGLSGFRTLTEYEAALADRILFHRYEQTPPLPPPIEAEEPAPLPEPVITLPPPPIPPPPPRGFLAYATMPAREFDVHLSEYAARLLPVTGQHHPGRRVVTRIVRRIGLFAARRGHFVAHRITGFGLRLIRHDPIPTEPPIQEPATPQPPPPEIAPEPIEPSRSLVSFETDSVLLSMGNCWDYFDYAYLHRICRDDGVRFICAVYDVIAMRLPHATPGPMHIYHRHWVEIGHSAAHLLAISRFTVEQYRELIGAPNGLSPPMSYAYLPGFLRARADDIGEVPVNRLLGREFVVYCSTIETRKNHQLLLQLWDRLRQEFTLAELPILVFAGKWGWGTEAVRQQSERNFHLRDRLLILDDVSDAELIWIYRNARFTLFPSLAEGYGLAATESLSFGTPVVISDSPSLVEATEALMPAYDPLDFMTWLEEMRRLLRDETRLDELRAAASHYRGPAYDTFGNAVRALIRVHQSAMPVAGAA
jgi:glycosyltransferase involved in cell wall biosynthesis